MTGFIGKMRNAARKRAQYNATVAEIRRMPQEVALDLNIHRGDAREIAWKAVYGN